MFICGLTELVSYRGLDASSRRTVREDFSTTVLLWLISRHVNALLPLLAALACCSVVVSAAEDNYLLRLQRVIGNTRAQLPALAKSAELAAQEFVAGGNLWVAGRQEDFISEACGRAGGLTAIAPLPQQTPGNHDVILYAVPGALSPEDQKRLDQWQTQGVTVIPFNSSAGVYKEHFPLDTVANVVALWALTGEFVSACTRLGKMPVLYQSYGLPGGRERATKYQGKRFHDDLHIKPLAAEELGEHYLQQLDRMLAGIESAQMPKIRKAAQWRRQASSATMLFTGHMFPRHAQDSRAPAFGGLAAVAAWEDKELLETNHPPDFVLYIGYQFAPKKLITQARELKVKLVYSAVQPNEPSEPAPNILYIDPAWPLADGCVNVPGYDIPILPASGVVQAAIYWTIASAEAR